MIDEEMKSSYGDESDVEIVKQQSKNRATEPKSEVDFTQNQDQSMENEEYFFEPRVFK